MGVIEAEPFSIHWIPDVGAVVTKVCHPHVGDHSKEFILCFILQEDEAHSDSPLTSPSAVLVWNKERLSHHTFIDRPCQVVVLHWY